MKIFFLPTSYPDAQQPQKNIFIYEQAKQLASMGHEITVLHIKKLPTSRLFTPIDRTVQKTDDGFAVRYTLPMKTLAEQRFPAFSKERFIRCSERLYAQAAAERGTPDVIYAHFSQWAGYAGTVLSEKYRVPLVTIEHFSKLVGDNLPAVLLDCVATTIEKSQAFICVSDALRDSLVKKLHPDKNITVISNMIDSSFRFHPVPSHDGFIFSAIGRLSAQKDYPTLIRAFVKAFAPDEAVTLRIGGSGEDLKKLTDMVEEAGRAHQILFLGNLSREQTIDEYIGCDCFALTSAYETFGLVYREALATGRPVVTTAHEGFRGAWWHDEYGFKVPVGDVDAAAAALRRMRDTAAQFDGRRISGICLSDCAADRIGKKIEDCLSHAVETYAAGS